MTGKAKATQASHAKVWLRKIEGLCAQKALQFTPLRRDVAVILAEFGKPIGAYEIMEQLSKLRGRRVAPPTVYRTLDFFVENRFVVKIESKQAYIVCDDPGHDHHGIMLICSGCGQSAEVDNTVLDKLLIETASASHFRLQRQVIEIEGLCEICADVPAERGHPSASS